MNGRAGGRSRRRRTSELESLWATPDGPAFAANPVAVQTRRFGILAIIVLLTMGMLGVRLAYVQLLDAPGYRDIATGNRIRVIETAAPRGRIVDVTGRVLAGSRMSFTVTLDWEALAAMTSLERGSIFATLTDELAQSGHHVPADTMAEQFERARRQALEPVVLAEDVSSELWITLTELDLAGISVDPRPVRTYPYGESASHLLGYLGTVGDDEEATELNRADTAARYRAGSEVGRAGLERIFERQLRGVPEVRMVEVDSKNRVVRTVEVAQAAAPGLDLHLTINIDLQRAAEQALGDQMEATRTNPNTPAPAGSFVAVDPGNGGVIALASLPGFDPGDFVFGLADDVAAELFADKDDPFLNRAIDGLYPAGSTFKPVPAYAALTSGLRGEYEVWNDQGSYRLSGCRTSAATKGCVFRNAKGLVMGPVDVRTALTRSSDTYFYSIGERLWIERDLYGPEILQDTAGRFGLGQPTGIELPGEADGRVPGPSQRQQLHDRYPEAFPDPRWYSGDNVNLSIGQGDLLVTPLQLANLYATLASGGIRYQPRLVNQLVDGRTGETVLSFEPRQVASDLLEERALNAIVDGLLAVPVNGTGATAFAGFPNDRFPIAAKTGTAEVLGHADNALFAGFGPLPEPRYAFAVVMEEAGFGGVAAAPVARRFFDWVALAEGITIVEPGQPVPLEVAVAQEVDVADSQEEEPSR